MLIFGFYQIKYLDENEQNVIVPAIGNKSHARMKLIIPSILIVVALFLTLFNDCNILISKVSAPLLPGAISILPASWDSINF